MNVALLYILCAILGIMYGFRRNRRTFVARSLASIEAVLEKPFEMRGKASFEEQIIIRAFIEETGFAVVSCPNCKDNWPSRLFCKKCSGHGYFAVPEENITPYDYPSLSGTKKLVLHKYFEGKVNQEEFDHMFEDLDKK